MIFDSRPVHKKGPIPPAHTPAGIEKSKWLVRYRHFRRLRRGTVWWILAEIFHDKIQYIPIRLAIHDWFQRTDANASI